MIYCCRSHDGYRRLVMQKTLKSVRLYMYYGLFIHILNAKNLAPPTCLQCFLQIENFFEILKLSLTYAYNSLYFNVCPSNLSFVVWHYNLNLKNQLFAHVQSILNVK